jgi:hypothetical protein
MHSYSAVSRNGLGGVEERTRRCRRTETQAFAQGQSADHERPRGACSETQQYLLFVAKVANFTRQRSPAKPGSATASRTRLQPPSRRTVSLDTLRKRRANWRTGRKPCVSRRTPRYGLSRQAARRAGDSARQRARFVAAGDFVERSKSCFRGAACSEVCRRTFKLEVNRAHTGRI